MIRSRPIRAALIAEGAVVVLLASEIGAGLGPRNGTGGSPGTSSAATAHATDVSLAALGAPPGFVVSDAAMDAGRALHVALAHDGDAYYSRLAPGSDALAGPVRVNARHGSVASRGEAGSKISVGSDGVIAVVWHRWNEPNVEVFFARSTDGGATFGDEAMLGLGLLPNVAVGSRGLVYVTWIGDPAGIGTPMAAPLMVTMSADSGRTFLPAAPVRNALVACGCCLPDIAVSPDGAVLIAYRAAKDNIRDVHLLRSLNGLCKFSDTLVHEDNWLVKACPNSGPALALDDPTRSVAIAWSSRGRALLALSQDGGRMFGSPESLPPENGEAESTPMHGMDRGGTAAVAWRAVRQTRAVLLRVAPDLVFVGESGLFRVRPVR